LRVWVRKVSFLALPRFYLTLRLTALNLFRVRGFCKGLAWGKMVSNEACDINIKS